MFGIASSTAKESMLESLLTAQVYAGVSLLTKCDGVFSNPKGLVFWNGGESSAHAIQSKVEGEPLPRKTSQFFFQKTPTRAFWSKAEDDLKDTLFGWKLFVGVSFLATRDKRLRGGDRQGLNIEIGYI